MTLADHYLSTTITNRTPDQLDYEHLYAEHCPDALYELGSSFRCPMIDDRTKCKTCMGCWAIVYRGQTRKRFIKGELK